VKDLYYQKTAATLIDVLKAGMCIAGTELP
jgi:hypothetical protein